MTQSKEAVQLISKHGHGISYGDVGKIDQNRVEAQSTASVPVPTNIVPGRITSAAGDNFNCATESLSGQHFDVLRMVLYQESTSGQFGQVVHRKTKKDKEMTKRKAVRRSVLTCPNVGGKQPGPKQLIGKMKLQWFTQCSSEHETMRKLDKAIILLRSMPLKIFEADI